MDFELPLVDLFSNALTGFFILQDGKFKLVNRTFMEFTGYKETDLLGKHSLSIVFKDDREAVRERTKTGMARAGAAGKHVGRPKGVENKKHKWKSIIP